MNLYLISQSVNKDYDTYDSAVVAAPDEEAARAMHPGGGTVQHASSADNWCGLDDVQVEYLGEAKEGMSYRIICASFNAG